jgi:hypothetical protein
MASKRDKSKLGRSPFTKGTKSQVGRLIEASFTTPAAGEETSKNVERGLIERFQEMKISLDLREILKSVRSNKDRSF